jgi:hypothetical protein
MVEGAAVPLFYSGVVYSLPDFSQQVPHSSVLNLEMRA